MTASTSLVDTAFSAITDVPQHIVAYPTHHADEFIQRRKTRLLTALKILHEKFCRVKKNLMSTNIVYRNLINCRNAGIILLGKKGREIASGVENWN